MSPPYQPNTQTSTQFDFVPEQGINGLYPSQGQGPFPASPPVKVEVRYREDSEITFTETKPLVGPLSTYYTYKSGGERSWGVQVDVLRLFQNSGSSKKTSQNPPATPSPAEAAVEALVRSFKTMCDSIENSFGL